MFNRDAPILNFSAESDSRKPGGSGIYSFCLLVCPLVQRWQFFWLITFILMQSSASGMTRPPPNHNGSLNGTICNANAVSFIVTRSQLISTEHLWEILEGCFGQQSLPPLPKHEGRAFGRTVLISPVHFHRVVESLARCSEAVLLVAQHITKPLYVAFSFNL